MRRDTEVRDTVAPATTMGAMTTTREEDKKVYVIDATIAIELHCIANDKLLGNKDLLLFLLALVTGKSLQLLLLFGFLLPLARGHDYRCERGSGSILAESRIILE